MIPADETHFISPDEDDELIRRLRQLEWPTVRPELKERCWQDFSRRMTGGAQEAEAERTSLDFSRRNTVRRESYTRRTPLERAPLAARAATGAAPWQLRPSRRIAALVS